MSAYDDIQSWRPRQFVLQMQVRMQMQMQMLGAYRLAAAGAAFFARLSSMPLEPPACSRSTRAARSSVCASTPKEGPSRWTALVDADRGIRRYFAGAGFASFT
ncbi:MAG TPA: hypothetical protein VFE72_01360 [Lysobacter sp.]|nr:hypothetical protein [Lysobacter sp.]